MAIEDFSFFPHGRAMSLQRKTDDAQLQLAEIEKQMQLLVDRFKQLVSDLPASGLLNRVPSSL